MDQNKAAESRTSKIKNSILEWIETIFISIAVIIFVLIFVFRIVEVDGDSMLPTLHEEERLITLTTLYQLEHNDIIVVSRTGKEPIVKRVIAMAGDTVDIDFEQGVVYINNQVVDEPFILEPTHEDGGSRGITYPVTVPEGYVFVMGDNRNDSLDSRFQEIGMISVDNILGEVVFRIFPFDQWGSVTLKKG